MVFINLLGGKFDKFHYFQIHCETAKGTVHSVLLYPF